MPKNIPIVFHNRSDYDQHFIIKKLAEELKEKITCLGENTKKIHNFYNPNRKEVTIIDKNGEEITKQLILHITIY